MHSKQDQPVDVVQKMRFTPLLVNLRDSDSLSSESHGADIHPRVVSDDVNRVSMQRENSTCSIVSPEQPSVQASAAPETPGDERWQRAGVYPDALSIFISPPAKTSTARKRSAPRRSKRKAMVSPPGSDVTPIKRPKELLTDENAVLHPPTTASAGVDGGAVMQVSPEAVADMRSMATVVSEHSDTTAQESVQTAPFKFANTLSFKTKRRFSYPNTEQIRESRPQKVFNRIGKMAHTATSAVLLASDAVAGQQASREATAGPQATREAVTGPQATRDAVTGPQATRDAPVQNRLMNKEVVAFPKATDEDAQVSFKAVGAEPPE